MSRILYGAPLSPYVRKARVCLQEKGLEHELEAIAPFTPPEWFYDLSPLGRIPAFKDEDFALADSGVIAQYLEDAYPDVPLYGRDARERARVRWLEKYADYEVAPLATFVIFGERLLKPSRGVPGDEALVAQARDERLPPLFDYLENQLGSDDFFVGGRLSLADIALTCQLVNMEYGGETLDAGRWPALAAHYARMRERPVLQAIVQSEQWMLQKLRERAARR